MTKRIFEERIQRVFGAMARKHLDVLVAVKPQNAYYLSGFNPIIQSQPTAVIVSRKGNVIIVTHSLRAEHAMKEKRIGDLCLFGRWGGRGIAAPNSPCEAIVRTLKSLFPNKEINVGLEYSFLPVSSFQTLQKALPKANLIPADIILSELRMVKDREEIALIEIAADIADTGMQAAIDRIRERDTEIGISIAAMKAMQNRWAEAYPDHEPVDFGGTEGGIINALWAYCLIGSRMNLMCDSPSTVRPQNGDLVFVVVWTAIDGYHAENERTVAVGSLREEQERAYAAVLRARHEAIQKIRPGVKTSEVYEVVRQVFVNSGYEDALPGRVGHGLGLGAHEAPSLSPSNNCTLQAGMVMSFEPALRIGKLGGVQHSDTILVTANGVEYLTRTPREFLSV